MKRFQATPALLAMLLAMLLLGACDSGGVSDGASSGSSSASSGSSVMAECSPGNADCPVQQKGKVTSTDSQPLGSTVKAGDGGSGVEASDYPTTAGSGSSGSGTTGTTTGPAPGPTYGTGR